MKSLLAWFLFSNGLGMSLPLSRVKNLVIILVIDERDSSTPNEDC